MTQCELNIVVSAFAGERNANGGLQSLGELIRQVPQCRWQLFTQQESTLCQTIRGAGGDVSILESVELRSSNPVQLLRSEYQWWRHLSKSLRDDRPQILLCNDIRALIVSAPVGKFQKVPVVFFVRDIFEPSRNYGLKWRLAAQLSDLILCLSAEMKQQLEQRLKTLTGRRPAVEYLYSIVNPQMMEDELPDQKTILRQQFSFPEQQFAIAYVAGVCEKKGQLDLLKNIKPFFAANPYAHLHFVGDYDPNGDDYCRQCFQTVQQQELEKSVTFHGFQPDVYRWYVACDLTLLASRREGLARCMIESLACGTPVVSFAVTSAEEILEKNRCGRVVRQGDYQTLIDSLQALLADEKLRQEMGLNGRRLSRDLFEGSKNANRFMELVSSLGAHQEGS